MKRMKMTTVKDMRNKLSITVLPIYLIHRMVMATGFHLWGFIKILGGSLIWYFGFFMVAFEQYVLLMSPNWHTE